MNWRDLLQARLLDLRPDSVCALDAAAHQLACDTLRDIPVRALENTPGQPCALALGIDALNGLDTQQALHLINQARLYSAPRLLIAALPGCALDEATFRALGFTLSGTDTAADVRIHDYDLNTYKTVPDWLNARFWAHPERWKP